jgi:hypothetical protein
MVPGRGLAAFDGRSWSDADSWGFYTPAGEPDLDVTAVLGLAPDGALWLRTDRGLARLDPTKLADGEPAAAWMTYALKEDMVIPSRHAVAFGPKGTVWFGATRFEPNP